MDPAPSSQRGSSGPPVYRLLWQPYSRSHPSFDSSGTTGNLSSRVYSISTLISLYSLQTAFFIDLIRDIYEAFVIYCFFGLLVEYLGGQRSLLILLHGRQPTPHPWPISKCISPIDISDPYTFLNIKRGIFQYVQVKPVLVIFTVIFKATKTYNDGDLKLTSGYTYVSIAYNFSVSLCRSDAS